MINCPKCGNNDFQIVVQRIADAKFDKDGVLRAEDNCSEEELKSVQCAKCGEYIKKSNTVGGSMFEWEWA